MIDFILLSGGLRVFIPMNEFMGLLGGSSLLPSTNEFVEGGSVSLVLMPTNEFVGWYNALHNLHHDNSGMINAFILTHEFIHGIITRNTTYINPRIHSWAKGDNNMLNKLRIIGQNIFSIERIKR